MVAWLADNPSSASGSNAGGTASLNYLVIGSLNYNLDSALLSRNLPACTLCIQMLGRWTTYCITILSGMAKPLLVY